MSKKGKIVKEKEKVVKSDKFIKILTIVFSVAAWILLIMVCFNDKFTPAATSITAAALFLIVYYYRYHKNSKVIIAVLGSLIVLLIAFTLFYTITNLY